VGVVLKLKSSLLLLLSAALAMAAPFPSTVLAKDTAPPRAPGTGLSGYFMGERL